MNQMEGSIGRDNNPSGENSASKKSLWLDAQGGILSEPDKGIRAMIADLPYLQMVDGATALSDLPPGESRQPTEPPKRVPYKVTEKDGVTAEFFKGPNGRTDVRITSKESTSLNSFPRDRRGGTTWTIYPDGSAAVTQSGGGSIHYFPDGRQHTLTKEDKLITEKRLPAETSPKIKEIADIVTR